MNELKGKSFLITGGTGTFGQAIARVLLDEYEPKVIRIFSRGELLQSEMAAKFGYNEDSKLRFILGDVRDRDRLELAMENIDIVIHAAAMKQVTSCEMNPAEAIQTNILGAVNLVEAAIKQNVPMGIALSTDKAANPNNFYGVTKLAMEKFFVQSNVFSRGLPNKFSCVRYGNVMMSRGSVIPIFLRQKDEGQLTITDPDMTRFWISVNTGVRFVLASLDRMQGGEVFIPKIPSSTLLDLAVAVAPDAQVKFIGILPGEKVHETLITEEEARRVLDLGSAYVIMPEPGFQSWSNLSYPEGHPVPDDFSYYSNNKSSLLSMDELRDYLQSKGVL